MIRLEHELSERSRKYLEYAAREDDQIAGMDNETKKMIRVVYGDEGSASFGGIDGAPRYGAASTALNKPPMSPPLAKRRVSAEDDSFKERVEKFEKVSGGLQDKNMWKSWKYLLSQLSSPDGVPPPAVNGRGRTMEGNGKREEEREETNSPTGSVRSKRSTWSSRSNTNKTLSRRSKSAFGSKKITHPSNDTQIPPVPRSPMQQSPMMRSTRGKEERSRTDSTDVDSDREGANTWGTDASVEGSLSTAPSSFAGHSRIRTGSQSSKAGLSPVIASSNGPWQSMPQLAKPSVTSEVLMGDAPIVTRVIPNKVVLSSSSSSSVFNSSRDSALNNDAPATPAVVRRLRAESPDQPRRSVGPSDVPEDAKPEDEEVVAVSPKQGARDLQNNSSLMDSRRGLDTPSSERTYVARPGSSDSTSTSRPSSAAGQRLKRVPPPVVNSLHNPPSWDSAYSNNDGRDSMQNTYDSDLTVRPLHNVTLSNKNQNGHQRSLSNHSQTSADGATYDAFAAASRSKTDNNLQSHSFANGTSKGSLRSAKSRNATTPPNGLGGLANSNPWVLQSLHSANTSQQSLNGSTGSQRGASPVVASSSLDEVRTKLIPRKAAPSMHPPPPILPPPKYAPPQPPLSSSEGSSDHHDSRQPALTSGIPVSRSRSSVTSSSNSGHSPSNNFLASFQSASRRPSLSESVQSAGTFG